MERDPLVRGLLLMLAVIGLLWLGGWTWQVISRFADVLLLFFLAWLLAFVLNPIARRLQLLGFRRSVAVGGVYAGLFVGLVAVGILIVPALVAQLVQLGASLPALASALQGQADKLHLDLVNKGLPEAQLSDIYRNAISRAEELGTLALRNSLALATTILGSVLKGLLVLILSFYIMLDGDKISGRFVDLLPPRYREGAASALEQIDRTFGGFIRGQLIQAAVYGLGTASVMELAGLPYLLVLSLVSGLAMLIPFIGPFVAMLPPVILAIILAPGSVWWVFALLWVLQLVVTNVLAPKIMSQSVGIHPLLVFAAALIGAKLAGAWGAIFGVPVAAMLYLMVRVFYQRVVLFTPLYRKNVPLSPDALVPSATRTSTASYPIVTPRPSAGPVAAASSTFPLEERVAADQHTAAPAGVARATEQNDAAETASGRPSAGVARGSANR